MKCPKCTGKLLPIRLADVEVDQCAGCAGVWFDFGELERVLAHEDADRLKKAIVNDPMRDVQRGPCPRCGGSGNMVRLASLQRPGLRIDSCSVCYGEWLDGGEFEALRNKGVFSSVAAFFKSLL